MKYLVRDRRLRTASLLAAAAVQAALALTAGAAPTVTYILSPNDDGQGNTVAGSFAVYAIDSVGDNGGIAAYSVDVQGYSSVINFAPEAIYDDGTGTGGTVAAGFTFLRSLNGADPIKATQDNLNPNRSRVRLVYGFGQTAGNLDSYAPAGSAGSTLKVQPLFDSKLLIATGTFSNGAAISLVPNSSSNRSNVFVSNGATTTTLATVVPVTAQTDTYTGPTGSWSNVANWSPQLPNLGDTALITGTSGDVLVTYDASATSVPLNRLTIDATAGATRTLFQTASTFSVSHEIVGLAGSGTLSISGGTHNVTASGTNGLSVAVNPGSIGTVNLTGGSLNVSSILSLGSGGTLAQSAGTLTAASTLNNGSLTQTAGAATLGTVTGTGSMTIGGSAAAAQTTVTTFSQASVTIADQGSLAVTPSTTARLANAATTLSITGSGQLDLANHSLLTASSDNVRTYVARAAGPVLPTNGLNAWTGPGLTSSLVKSDAANSNARQLAVGYFDSRDNAQTGLSVPAGKTLVQYTVYGDATGDSKVDIADLSVWNNNFGAGDRWSQGDWNYDGKIDISDLSVWNNDFGNQLTGGTIKPGARAGGAVAAASSALASHATPTLTSSASASPAATPLPATLELDVNTATGDATLNSGGVTLAAIELDSASGILLKSGWQSLRLAHGYNQWSFPRGTPSATSLSEYTSDASSASGQPATLAAGSLTDYGLIFPVGFSDPTDLTFKYNIADPTTGLTAPRTGTVVFTSGVPEPTCLALGGVAAIGLLARKRRNRPVRPSPCKICSK